MNDELKPEREMPLILVVDDTPENIGVLMEVLSDAGYELRMAENGRVAIEQARQLQPDLILLDIMMPEMDGFATIEALKSNPSTVEIPVIFMTALSEASDKVKGFQLGAVDYVTKPFEHEEVLARVGAHVKLSRLQHELIEANEHLEEANELKAKFFRIARHDLRNPIAVVQLTIEFLKSQCTTNKPIQDFEHKLDLMKRAAVQMQEIVENYLDNEDVLSLLQDALCHEGVVNDVVNEVIEQCRVYAVTKDIRVSLVHEDPQVRVVFDRSRYHQALSNLITNAIKFSPPGSSVHLMLTCEENDVVVRVKDNGPGVKEHERSKLFTEFGKVSNKPTAGESSSGLGLWICRKMIEAQDGSVGADFPEEGGSVFWIRLPLIA